MPDVWLVADPEVQAPHQRELGRAVRLAAQDHRVEKFDVEEELKIGPAERVSREKLSAPLVQPPLQPHESFGRLLHEGGHFLFLLGLVLLEHGGHAAVEEVVDGVDDLVGLSPLKVGPPCQVVFVGQESREVIVAMKKITFLLKS